MVPRPISFKISSFVNIPIPEPSRDLASLFPRRSTGVPMVFLDRPNKTTILRTLSHLQSQGSLASVSDYIPLHISTNGSRSSKGPIFILVLWEHGLDTKKRPRGIEGLGGPLHGF